MCKVCRGNLSKLRWKLKAMFDVIDKTIEKLVEPGADDKLHSQQALAVTLLAAFHKACSSAFMVFAQFSGTLGIEPELPEEGQEELEQVMSEEAKKHQPPFPPSRN